MSAPLLCSRLISHCLRHSPHPQHTACLSSPHASPSNCVRGFHPAEHAGRSSLDSWKLQRCGLGPSSLSAGTTDQGSIRILSFDAQGQAAGTFNGVVELHDGEPRLCAPVLQTPTLHTLPKACQLATLSLGLARLEPQHAVLSNLAAPKRA